MCNIWKIRSKDEISLEKVAEIFSDKLFRKTKVIKLMGGEPTLHSRFPELVKLLKECMPNAQIVVSTNGFPFKRMKKVIDTLLGIEPTIIFSLSLDGREKVHDKMRGIKGCFKEVRKASLYLFKLSKKFGRRLLRFSFTITPWNYKELPKVLDFAKKLDTYVGVRLMHINEHFYRNTEKSLTFSNEMLEFVEKVLRTEGRNVFQKNIVSVYRKGRKLPCFAFITTVTIEPDGSIKPCIYSEKTSIRKLSEVWNRSEGRKLRRKIKHCTRCWSDCQTIPDIKGEYFFEKLHSNNSRFS